MIIVSSLKHAHGTIAACKKV